MVQRNYGLRHDNRPTYEPPPLRPSVALRVAAVLFGGVVFAALIASAFLVAHVLHVLHAVLAP
jgi:hypothetical protein